MASQRRDHDDVGAATCPAHLTHLREAHMALTCGDVAPLRSLLAPTVVAHVYRAGQAYATYRGVEALFAALSLPRVWYDLSIEVEAMLGRGAYILAAATVLGASRTGPGAWCGHCVLVARADASGRWAEIWLDARVLPNAVHHQ